MKKCHQSALLILLGALLALCLSSCSSSPSDKELQGASPDESTAPPAPSETGSGGWLSGMPEVIPPFANGTFSNQSEKIDYPTQTLYSLYYEKVTIENAREYLKKLTEAGFSLEEDKNVKPGNLSAFGAKGEGAGKIGYMLGFQPSGHLDLSFTVFKK